MIISNTTSKTQINWKPTEYLRNSSSSLWILPIFQERKDNSEKRSTKLEKSGSSKNSDFMS